MVGLWSLSLCKCYTYTRTHTLLCSLNTFYAHYLSTLTMNSLRSSLNCSILMSQSITGYVLTTPFILQTSARVTVTKMCGVRVSAFFVSKSRVRACSCEPAVIQYNTYEYEWLHRAQQKHTLLFRQTHVLIFQLIYCRYLLGRGICMYVRVLHM